MVLNLHSTLESQTASKPMTCRTEPRPMKSVCEGGLWSWVIFKQVMMLGKLTIMVFTAGLKDIKTFPPVRHSWYLHRERGIMILRCSQERCEKQLPFGKALRATDKRQQDSFKLYFYKFRLLFLMISSVVPY